MRLPTILDVYKRQVLNYAYAMDKTAVYTTSGRIPDVELAAFQAVSYTHLDVYKRQGYAYETV